MVKIKSVEEIARKWVDVTPGRAAYYEAGVKAAGSDWQSGAKGGQKAFVSAMQDAKVLARREQGINEKTAEKYVRKAGTLGPDRFRSGIPAAQSDYASEFAPFHAVIASWVPPERGPRGDPKNYDIVKSIGDALHKKRVGAS